MKLAYSPFFFPRTESLTLCFKEWRVNLKQSIDTTTCPGVTEESIVLASSPGCPRQIVKYNHNVYGFQCHLEIMRDGIQDLIGACPKDLAPSKFTQSIDSLLQKNDKAINQLCFKLLERLNSFPKF